MLEHMISWKVLKNFIQECSNDDLGLTLNFLHGKANLFTVLTFIGEEFLDFVEDFDVRVNKYG